jgi:hypothetical protein
MRLRACQPRTPVHGTVASGAASASSIEQSSGSDFINQNRDMAASLDCVSATFIRTGK